MMTNSKLAVSSQHASSPAGFDGLDKLLSVRDTLLKGLHGPHRGIHDDDTRRSG